MDVKKFPAIVCISLAVFASGAQAGQVVSDAIECLTNAPIARTDGTPPAGEPALSFCSNSGGRLWSPGPNFDIASDPVVQTLPGISALAVLDEVVDSAGGWVDVPGQVVADNEILDPTSTLFERPALLLFRLLRRLSLP